MTRIWSVNAPHFNAGVVEDERGIIIRAAPILKWSINWSITRFTNYCSKKKWTCEKGVYS